MQDGSIELLALGGLELRALGAAYLLLLASMALATIAFALCRSLLVVTPNLAARHYGLYMVVALMSLGIAATLENELVPAEATTLGYAMFPQLLLLLSLHLWVYYDHQPWLISLGASATLATMIVFSIVASVSGNLHIAHWLTLALLTALLAYLWYQSISTKRGFIRARSIHIDSKETRAGKIPPQKPWLGLPQWVALSCASLILATVNETLQGSGVADVPALAVVTESLLMLCITGLVCAIPATTYWLAHKHWMPELTRFVWLVWLVVGFAFVYGNFLTSLDRT